MITNVVLEENKAFCTEIYIDVQNKYPYLWIALRV